MKLLRTTGEIIPSQVRSYLCCWVCSLCLRHLCGDFLYASGACQLYRSIRSAAGIKEVFHEGPCSIWSLHLYGIPYYVPFNTVLSEMGGLFQ